MRPRFLPTSRAEIAKRGWDGIDFLLVTGDAYVDHPSFGAALIGRLLESRGYRVGILAQPDWKSADAFRVLGSPKLAVLVTAGNLDSMVSNFTVARNRRREDAYAPGGTPGRRPDRATIVYTVRAKEAHRGVPVILGGVEASLRRFAHYDYWSDSVRRSVLMDSKADLLVYGMGERAILSIAERLAKGTPLSDITDVPGTAYRAAACPEGATELPDFEAVATDKREFAKAFVARHGSGILAQRYGKQWIVQNPPACVLSTAELDEVYELPYVRQYHPDYASLGGVPAIEEVQFSLVSARGCFGGCSFCSIGAHQGAVIQARSHESLIREAKQLVEMPEFKGYIHDVGGPTANFRISACRHAETRGPCTHRSCLAPSRCSNLEVSHSDYCDLLRKLRSLKGVKKVFIRSGIRYDYLMADPDRRFLRELCEHHVSGQLKVAPEHVSPEVLALMGKPSIEVFDAFAKEFEATNRRLGKKQYLIPYFLSSHPGSDLAAAIELAEYIRDSGFIPDQVQDFYPTPGTLSTCMYHTGLDPRSMKPVYVPRGKREKATQRALLQFNRKENRKLVREALIAAGRRDLIGRHRKALIPS